MKPRYSDIDDRLLRLRLSASNHPEPHSLEIRLYHGDQELVPRVTVPLSKIGLRQAEAVKDLEQMLGKSTDPCARDLARHADLNQDGRRWFLSLLERLPASKVMWLEIARPKGSLTLYPWEEWLQPIFNRPILRLPRHLVKPARRHDRLELVYCCSAPLAKGPIPIVDLLHANLDSLEEAAIPATVHVFVDAEVEDAVRRNLRHRWFTEGTLKIYPAMQAEAYCHDPSPRETTARRGELSSPWLQWIAAALGSSVDLVHFVTHGYLSRGRGSLAFARSPMANDDPRWARFIDSTELTSFLDVVGSAGLILTSPPNNRCTAGLRALADEIVDDRPGPVLVHDSERDNDGSALAAALAFLYSDHDLDLPPQSATALSLYLHPDLQQAWQRLQDQPSGIGDNVSVPIYTSSDEDMPPPQPIPDNGSFSVTGPQHLGVEIREPESEYGTPAEALDPERLSLYQPELLGSAKGEEDEPDHRKQILDRFTLAQSFRRVRARNREVSTEAAGSLSMRGGESTENGSAIGDAHPRWLQASQRILERYVSETVGSTVAKTINGRAAQKGTEDAYLFLKKVLAEAGHDVAFDDAKVKKAAFDADAGEDDFPASATMTEHND